MADSPHMTLNWTDTGDDHGRLTPYDLEPADTGNNHGRLTPYDLELDLYWYRSMQSHPI